MQQIVLLCHSVLVFLCRNNYQFKPQSCFYFWDTELSQILVKVKKAILCLCVFHSGLNLLKFLLKSGLRI